MDQRGVVCKECQEKIPSTPLPSAVLKALQFISLTPAKKLYTFLLSEEAGGAFALLIRDYYRRYVAHHFKSEDFLDL